MKKKIKIKIRSNKSISLYCYHILIFDDDRLVFDDYTKNGEIYFNVEYKKGYCIIIINPLGFRKKIAFYYNNYTLNEFTIVMKNCLSKKSHLITIKLTDHNYKGLPILKGKIVLWNT